MTGGRGAPSGISSLLSLDMLSLPLYLAPSSSSRLCARGYSKPHFAARLCGPKQRGAGSQGVLMLPC